LSYTPGLLGRAAVGAWRRDVMVDLSEAGAAWLGRASGFSGSSAVADPLLDDEVRSGAGAVGEGLPGDRAGVGVGEFLDPLADQLGRLADHRGAADEAGG